MSLFAFSAVKVSLFWSILIEFGVRSAKSSPEIERF